MISPESGLNVALLAYRVEEARQPCGEEALYRNLRPVRPGRLSRSGGRLLSRLGHHLLALGQRLEQRSLPQPTLVPMNLQAQRRQ